MNISLEQELIAHIENLILEGVLTVENFEEWHFHAFNEDYYIIGYYEASQWLKKHGIGELEGASICREYELDNFGESTGVYENTEQVVNMLAYIYGEEVLTEIQEDLLEKLKEEEEA